MSVALKHVYLLADTVHQNHGPYHYAKASSLIQRVSKKYDQLLNEDCDVFIMPTLNCLPCKLPSTDVTIGEKITTALDMVKNTAIFDGTGHPALSLNCGFSNKDGLPVGLMIVGKHWDEICVLNVASIIEEVLKM